MALILNRSNAAMVVDDLAIQAAQLPISPFDRIKNTAKSLYRELIGSTPSLLAQDPRSKLPDDLLGNISVEAIRSKTAETTSNVLEIKLDTTDPKLAPRALSAMVDAYLQVGTQQNRRLGMATTKLLQSQIDEAQVELLRIENAIVRLAIRESERNEVTAAVTPSRTGAVTTGASAVSRRDLGRGTNEAATSQLVQQLLDLQSQLEELRQTYTDETESVRKLKQRVNDARTRLASQVRATAANNAEFDRFDRQRLLAQDHYVELRRKLDQIDLYMQLTPAALDGRIVIDPPTRPDASDARKKKVIALIGPAAGILLGVLLALLQDFLRKRMRTRRELERLLGMPLLGILPSVLATEKPAGPTEFQEITLR